MSNLSRVAVILLVYTVSGLAGLGGGYLLKKRRDRRLMEEAEKEARKEVARGPSGPPPAP